MKKILTILLAVVLLCSFAAGCQKSEVVTEDVNTAEPTVEPTAEPIDVSQFTLKELAEKHGLYVGGCCEPYHLEEEEFAKTFAENFNQITPENRMKMGLIQPVQGEFAFEDADVIVDFAEENDMLLRGHTLVWHNQLPTWIEARDDWTKEELTEILETHIKTVVGRYKGKVDIWDVVNEPLELSTYRETIWYDVIGPEYIDMAFQWAHEADPDAKLYLNDYFVEEENAKSTALYNMAADMLERGIPLDGVGLQFHINLDEPYDMISVYSNVKRFTELGLEVDFTEIDVRIGGTVTEEALMKQASIYRNLYELAAGMDGVNVVTTWGMTDKYTWVNSFYEGYSSPLLFDANYQEKLCLTAVKEVLAQDEVVLDYENRLTSLASQRIVIAPLSAKKITDTPVIDGIVDEGEWDETINYSFVYNQLNAMDQSYDYNDVYGEFRVGYKDGYFYGMVTRKDGATHTSNALAYENDCVEVFLSHETYFIQLRTEVGETFASDAKCKEEVAVWSEDGTVLEFSFKLPVDDAAGMTMGFNMALADNDGGNREVQLYPVTGRNVSYQGKDLIGIRFEGDTPIPSNNLRICPAHTVNPKLTHPVIDGVNADAEWLGGVDYIFGFNQYNEIDKSMPEFDDFYGRWKFVYDENIMYGQVLVEDNVIYTDDSDSGKNDHVELSMKLNGENYTVSIEVGNNEVVGEFPYEIKAVWSEDNTCLEYMITFDDVLEAERIIPFNICYTDNDGDGIVSRMYPINGDDKPFADGNMAELRISE